MANSGLATTVEKSRKPLAPVKPMYAMIRRDCATLPTLRASLAPNHTLMGLAKPPGALTVTGQRGYRAGAAYRLGGGDSEEIRRDSGWRKVSRFTKRCYTDGRI